MNTAIVKAITVILQTMKGKEFEALHKAVNQEMVRRELSPNGFKRDNQNE